MLLRIAGGFAFAAVLSAQVAEYGGPSILGRGLAPSVTNSNAAVTFQPYISVNGFCDTGLTAPNITANGQLPNQTQCGVEGAAGVYGSHNWRHTSLGLSYSGDYRHYPNASAYDGTDQSLGLGLTHHLTKHVLLKLRADAGTNRRNFLSPVVLAGVEANVISIPNTQIIDSRLEFGGATADMSVQLSPRVSFDLGGEAFAVRYQVPFFYGVTGLGAHGDLAYRYSRFGTIGASYAFRHFAFTHAFGATDIHLAALVWSMRLSKTWELRAQGGVARLETLGTEVVQVDPIVAAITGQSTGIIAAYHLNYAPSYAVDLTHKFQDATLTLDVSRSITPGNGIYLSSSLQGASVTYNHNPVHHWYFTANAGYLQLVSLVQTLPGYKTYTAGVGVSRTIAKGLSFTTRGDFRYSDVGSLIFKRDTYRVTAGLSWSPGDLPVVLW